ncbi:hypothetical protein VSAL_I1236 [Aliivibrio salmonicida LFI1238]|uniref:Uncharacterized protein n=1 Tax=Aliivibrio salmonicida (strain LFI1238) TaxID=316275 RepID=B6EJX4_ALISL|nr:hypothetical protein VSAL_I1236 [Aliivibrio salmonicida LFI1238]
MIRYFLHEKAVMTNGEEHQIKPLFSVKGNDFKVT